MRITPLSLGAAPPLSRRMTHPFAISTYVPSANVAAVARAAPDGHMVLVGHTAETAVLPHFVGNLGYDPRKDFQPVSLIAVFPIALVVKSSVQATTLKDFLAQSRAASRGLLFASSGPGTVAIGCDPARIAAPH